MSDTEILHLAAVIESLRQAGVLWRLRWYKLSASTWIGIERGWHE